jgi:hypothetical protein
LPGLPKWACHGRTRSRKLNMVAIKVIHTRTHSIVRKIRERTGVS